MNDQLSFLKIKKYDIKNRAKNENKTYQISLNKAVLFSDLTLTMPQNISMKYPLHILKKKPSNVNNLFKIVETKKQVIFLLLLK